MSTWEYIKGIFLIFGIPAVSYLMVLADPFSYWVNGEKERSLGFWFLAVPYWVVLFFAHKYKSQLAQNAKKQAQQRERIYQLGVLIDNEHFTKRDRQEVRTKLDIRTLSEESPELAEEIKWREEKPFRKSIRRHASRQF